MKIRFIIFISFLFIYININAVKNNIILKNLSIEQGLPGVSVQAIFQDSKGIMWLAVEAIGVSIFDGRSYTTFSNIDGDSTSLSNNFAIKIIEDKENNIWIATLNGLNKFDRQSHTFTRYFHSNSDPNTITNNKINDLLIDNYNNLWVATDNGISIYNKLKNSFYNILYDPSNEVNDQTNISILDLHQDIDQNIWVGTSGYGLMFFPKNEIKAFLINMSDKPKEQQTIINQLSPQKTYIHDNKDPNSIMDNRIWSIENDNNNNLWIGLHTGLQFFDRRTNKFRRIKFRREDAKLNRITTVRNLHFDKNQMLWAGTTSDGLIIYDTSNDDYQYFSIKKDPNCQLKSNSVRAIFEDQSGMMWIGTKFEGIHLYDRRQEEFNHISYSIRKGKGLNDAFVMSIVHDGNDKIYIGTKYGGINKYNLKSNEFDYLHYNIFNNKNEIVSNRIQTLLVSKDKNALWVGTEQYFEKFDLQNNKTNQIYSGTINSLCFDNNDRIWIGTGSGILLYDYTSNRIVHLKTKHHNILYSADLIISKLFFDSNNNMWIGTMTSGVYKYKIDTDDLTAFQNNPNDSSSISGNMVRSFTQDRYGNIWIGTKSAGLNKYIKKSNSFKRIQELSSRTIYSIVEDNFSNFWMGTHNGIVKYVEKEDRIEEFNIDYGIQGKVFEPNAFDVLKNGDILLGGQNGFNIFNPLNVNRQYYKAPMIISRFKVFDATRIYDIDKPQIIELNRKDNYISFEYALLDYANPNLNKYAYKLEGVDKDWIYSSRNYVSYTNIPPGSYKFTVKGANMDEIWNKEGISVTLKIPQPLWMNKWFQAFFIALLISIAYSIYYLRTRASKEREEKLKTQVLEQTKALRDANEELTQKSNMIVAQNQELQNHHENLESLIKERTFDLEKAKEKAEESDQLKSAFLANLSHEIRTPLNAIMGFSSLISSNHFPNSELKEINRVIQNNGNSLTQLINDIIDISMIDSNQLEIYHKPFNLNKSIIGIYDSFANEIDTFFDKKIDLILSIDNSNDHLIIESDIGRIKQIFSNLFSNAIKFTKRGFIKMGYKLDTNNSTLTFFMEDSGIGIEGKFLKSIFNRFQKVESSNEELFGGTGLGLAISKNLTELLGGDMWAESKQGKGTTFYFTIKLKITKEIEPKKEIPIINTNSNFDWSNKRILIAEDEESNFLVLKTMLRKTKVKITHVEDGKSACEMALNNFYDLILMDIKLPGMSGDEVTMKIKKSKSIPIIAQTAFATQTEINLFKKAGFDDYITKPITAEKLLNSMGKFL